MDDGRAAEARSTPLLQQHCAWGAPMSGGADEPFDFTRDAATQTQTAAVDLNCKW